MYSCLIRIGKFLKGKLSVRLNEEDGGAAAPATMSHHGNPSLYGKHFPATPIVTNVVEMGVGA